MNHHYEDSDDYDGEDEEGEYDDEDDQDDSNLNGYRRGSVAFSKSKSYKSNLSN